ncbi:MAG: nitroreductase family protein [Dehalococcoidales bacterium]|nr:nitroreductase family protein [Dehalococcoidales bacterium]
MDFKEVILKRQSIRDFTDQPVSDDKINAILEAARIAQSGCNFQPWKFVVVRDARIKEQLMQAANNQFHVGQAPVIIAAVALDPVRMMPCEVPACAVDLAIAVENMALAAVDQGLGSCWIGAFSQNGVKKILGVPEKYRVDALLPVGYPKQAGERSPRKSMDEIVCYDRFG